MNGVGLELLSTPGPGRDPAPELLVHRPGLSPACDRSARDGTSTCKSRVPPPTEVSAGESPTSNSGTRIGEVLNDSNCLRFNHSSSGTSLRPYHDTVVLRLRPAEGPAAGRRAGVRLRLRPSSFTRT
eukprot:1164-Hanusia_phi.AAC.1